LKKKLPGWKRSVLGGEKPKTEVRFGETRGEKELILREKDGGNVFGGVFKASDWSNEVPHHCLSEQKMGGKPKTGRVK